MDRVRALAWAVLAATLVMISLGAFVTSRDAGLSIPDGFTNHGAVVPSEQLSEGYVTPEGRAYSGADVAAEWVHRVVGWTLGVLSIALAVSLRRRGPVRLLGYGAVLLVGLQGIVGALGVKLRQPGWMVVPHAFLAQSFLCVAVALVFFTSSASATGASRSFVLTARAGVAIAFAQLLLGALYRHENQPAALLAHVFTALAIGGVAAALASLAAMHQDAPRARIVLALGFLVLLQFFLGLLAWLFRSAKSSPEPRSLETILFPTLHVINGALILAGFARLAIEPAPIRTPAAVAA